MGLQCIESLGQRERLADEAKKNRNIESYSDGNDYDANAFLYIKNLIKDIDVVDGDSPIIILHTEDTTQEDYLSDCVAFFLGINLLKIVGENQYAINMKKFQELDALYIKKEEALNGTAKKLGTIK